MRSITQVYIPTAGGRRTSTGFFSGQGQHRHSRANMNSSSYFRLPSILLLAAFATAQDLYFTSPTANAITALGSPLNYTAGQDVRVAWYSTFNATTLRVWQGPMVDGSYIGEVLSASNPPGAQAYTWSAEPPDSQSSSGLYLELVNDNDSTCGNCKVDSLPFVVSRPSSITSSITSSSTTASSTSSASSSSSTSTSTSTSSTSSPSLTTSSMSANSAGATTSSSSSASASASTTDTTSSASSTSSSTVTAATNSAAALSNKASQHNHQLVLGLAIGLGVGIPLLLLLLGCCIFALLRRRRKHNPRRSTAKGDGGPVISRPTLDIARGQQDGASQHSRHPLHAPNHIAAAYFPTTRWGRRSNAASTAPSTASSYHGPFQFEIPPGNQDFEAKSVTGEVHDAASHGLARSRASTPSTQRTHWTNGQGGRLRSIDESGGRGGSDGASVRSSARTSPDWPLPPGAGPGWRG
ncbi:hypothetical protein BAUCODRAFT_498908 [Baudoinia panamericana UAMH 10762]|uniref:Mid2 domain-containing protein n=1 Tax=Baudoinia panamericana (strain UAMH 10762) TaxID=717646 RepID=M2N9A7_BAUPA|nr:uncharacterized protein BAUCODRAFT_498908 [Baudoinia panamericana UAMH 10762]EMC95684.1 hypothetical protein BAUCODRAFT_498908 [Baudoinia panamericana UAMH 10762]